MRFDKKSILINKVSDSSKEMFLQKDVSSEGDLFKIALDKCLYKFIKTVKILIKNLKILN